MGIFKSIKRVVTGEVIRQLDSTGNGGMTTVSLRLKRDRKDTEKYVVLALISSGNYQYCSLSTDEFKALVRSALELQEDLEPSLSGN